ncbi:MAG TPA: PadR family transcriptional regulator [Verrucomicrobiae bacterium]|nr:PadR family transcriptional regulator [Verrucomicrobiae bacterium]
MAKAETKSAGSGAADARSDLVRGTLEMLILKALVPGPLHGLGVARRVGQITRGAFEVGPGSLFPALHRMEAAGWLASEWSESENRRRAKFYTLTKAGRRRLEHESKRWGRVSLAIARALEAT